MIRIEPETSAPFLLTNAQLATANQLISFNPTGHFDFVENRYKQDSVTHTRLHLWSWPADRDGVPVRWWIEEDGHLSMVEDCHWITDEEWPAWAGTPDNNEKEN